MTGLWDWLTRPFRRWDDLRRAEHLDAVAFMIRSVSVGKNNVDDNADELWEAARRLRARWGGRHR